MSILITADALANHVPAGWPDESLAGSDSEELDTEPHLKVETKVSVELHRQTQGNHCGDRPPDPESGVLAKPVAVLSSQPQEQRKGTSGEPCYLSLEQTLAQHIGQGQESLFSKGILWGVWVDPGQVGKNQVRLIYLLNDIRPQLSLPGLDLVVIPLLPGILKNKVTYPPPLPEQPLKCRLREKLADCEHSPMSSRTSSLGSGDGVHATDCVITIKTQRKEPGREHLNGVAMNVRTGSAQANGSDSE